MGIFLVFFMYAAWSSVFSIGKLVLENGPPVFLTGFRMFSAGVILLSYLFIKDRSSLKIRKNQVLPIIALAVFSIYLTNVLELWGLQYLTAAKTCFIYSISPFFSAIFSYFHFGERMNLKKLIGMLIGFIGFIPVLKMQTGSEGLFNAFSIISWPELAIMGAALFSVYGWILLRIIVKEQTISPIYANGYSMLIGGLMAFAHSLFIDSWTPTPVINNHFLPFIGGIVLMIFVSNIFCFNLYGYMLKRYTATFLSFIGLLSPIFASINSWIILKEPPSWKIFFSSSIVSFGLFLIYQAELKQGYIVKKKKKLLEV